MIGQLGTVLHVDAGEFWAQLSNGAVLTYDTVEEYPVEPGDRILCSDDDFVLAPKRFQIEQPELRVGVVRLRKKRRTLVETGGSLFWIPTIKKSAYGVWETVLWTHDGVVRRITTEAIRPGDHAPASLNVANQFEVPSGSVAETFADIGGLQSQVREARNLIAMLNDSAGWREKGIKPIRGVLFAGESGTGKTLLARAMANESGATFFQVRGPEITSQWVNETEVRLRALLDAAEQCEKAIVFFDEVDSVGAARSAGQHHMSNQLVTQLLTLMDGFKSQSNTLIIGATNRPEILDRALVRSGRFDKTIYFTLPTLGERVSILKVTQPRHAAQIDVTKLADLTPGWNSADLQGIWTQAQAFANEEGRGALTFTDCLIGCERMRSRTTTMSTVANGKEERSGNV